MYGRKKGHNVSLRLTLAAATINMKSGRKHFSEWEACGMQLAKIIGNAKSITKSDELYGAELLVAVPVDMETMQEAGKPFLVADKLGAQEGQLVVCAAVCTFQQGDAAINMVVAIPESLIWNGEERFGQTVEHIIEEPEPVPPQDSLEEFDPVSSLTAEFKALHQELDRLSADEAAKQNTNAVPYEEYAKYLTTDFEPVDASAQKTETAEGTKQKKTGYSRVGYRSERKK